LVKNIQAADTDSAGVWLKNAKNYVYGGSFTGSVWTKQPHYLIMMHAKGNTIDGKRIPINLS
jgi:hypothetical protein